MIRGGRFNPPGIPALYLASEPQTALMEVHNTPDIEPNPQIIVPVESEFGLILDLTSEKACAAVGLSRREIYEHWSSDPAKPSKTQKVALDVIADKTYIGAKYISEKNAFGQNYVIWRFDKIRKIDVGGIQKWEMTTPFRGYLSHVCIQTMYGKRSDSSYQDIDDDFDQAISDLNKLNCKTSDFDRLSKLIVDAAKDEKLYDDLRKWLRSP